MPRLIARVLILGVLVGCGDSTSVERDASDDEDATDPGGDRDRDGVCDGTELARGTDADASDSDEDGFSDYAEILGGFDPLDPSSPDRDQVYVLRETPEASLQVPLTQSVRGAGEDYSGAFEATGRPDDAGDTAATFYTGSVATFAEPPENASVVDPTGEAFRGVVGRTLLGFELRFAFGGATPRLCARSHRWRYNIKRSDGRLIGAQGGLLLILPPGQTLATAQWCLPAGGCI